MGICSIQKCIDRHDTECERRPAQVRELLGKDPGIGKDLGR